MLSSTFCLATYFRYDSGLEKFLCTKFESCPVAANATPVPAIAITAIPHIAPIIFPAFFFFFGGTGA